MKKQGKKWMLVVLALLAVVTVTLPLVGCKNDTVAEQTGDGTGSGSGNQGSGDPEQPVTYTVSFNTNGGGSIDSQTIVNGQTATKPADPTLENNVFDGWYSDKELTSEYDFTTPVTGSFTLYAKWVKRIKVNASDVSSEIEGLTGDGSYILVVTGKLNDLSAITAALSSNKSAKVNLDLSKATGLTTIGVRAFMDCDSLTSICIPEGVKSIGGSAFSGCSGLTSISIPSSVTSIGDAAFDGCSGLTSITIPEGVTTIETRAFGGCSSLNISVDENNTKYSSVNGMLLDKEKTILIAYPSAKETVTKVPSSVTSIGERAFGSCSGLTSITIPASVTSIGDYAFIGCSGLTSIDLSKATGLTTIGNDAFYGCKSLTSISIPSSVTSIGGDAFYGCSGLEEVTMEANTPPELGSSAFSNTSTGLQILVPSSSEEAYKNATTDKGWDSYKDKIKPYNNHPSIRQRFGERGLPWGEPLFCGVVWLLG